MGKASRSSLGRQRFKFLLRYLSIGVGGLKVPSLALTRYRTDNNIRLNAGFGLEEAIKSLRQP